MDENSIPVQRNNFMDARPMTGATEDNFLFNDQVKKDDDKDDFEDLIE